MTGLNWRNFFISKRRIMARLLVATLALFLLVPTQLGCSASVGGSLVQVWSLPSDDSESVLISSGVVVGDGFHALTIMSYLDYVRYSPGPVQVVSTKARQNASVEGFQAGTGFTLLKLETRLPAAPLGPVPKTDQPVVSWELKGSNWAVTNQDLHVVTIPGRPPDAAFFNIGTGESPLEPVFSAGTVVSDETGKVLGLAEPLGDAPRLGNPPPTIAIIGVGLQLLKP